MAIAIDGVDLSPSMIAKAKARGIYRELIVGDIETALAQLSSTYDLVLAADTIVYIGDLTVMLREVERKLSEDGYFLFTAEKADREGFELGPKRRWRHSEGYLRDLAGRSGFQVVGLVAATPRHEAGQPVEGFAVALAR
jgi:predicted TPR repeat methyltransferase